MKFLVCISQVPDTTTRISFTNNNTSLNTAGVQFIINPYDELALTRALEMKEAGGGTVTAIMVGTAAAEPNLRKALAIGADDAIRVNAEPSDSFFVATQIAEVARKNQYDIILTGKESIDFNGSSVGPMVAALLDLPFVSIVSKLTPEGSEMIMEREIDGGKEILSCPAPLVLSAGKGLAEPRIPNMRGIMSARTKPLTVAEPVACETTVTTVSFELPPPKAACKMVPAENPAQLVELLHNEARII